MNFEFFNGVTSNSDMSRDIEAMPSTTLSTPPVSMVLSLDDELLLSFNDNSNKSLTLPVPTSFTANAYSPDGVYLIPELTAACTIEETVKESGTDGLFLENEHSGVWVLENRSDQRQFKMASRTSSLPLLCSTGHFTTPPLRPASTLTEPAHQFKIQSQHSLLTTKADGEQGKVSCKRKFTHKRGWAETTTTKRSIGKAARAKKVGQFSKALPRSVGIKRVAVANANACKVAPLAEKFLKALADSVTQQITKTVQKELHRAIEGFQAYVDARLPQNCIKSGQTNEKMLKLTKLCSKYTQTTKGKKYQVAEIWIEDAEQAERGIPFASEKIKPKTESPEEIKGIDADKAEFGLKDMEEYEKKQPTDSYPHPVDHLKGKGVFDKNQTNALMKYMTATALVEDETKTSTETDSLIDGDIFNFSIGNIDLDPPGLSDTFTIPKFDLEIIKTDVNTFGFEESGPPNCFAIHATKIDQLPVLKGNNIRESCTDLIPYIPVPKTLPGRHSKRRKTELVPKPELINQCKFKKALLCDICSRPFLNNSSLKQHQSFHRPQRPFHCEDAGCAKSYKTRSELNRHMIVHSGEKKYGCVKCGKTFLRKQYLKTHLVRHNEGLTWQCTLCAKIFVSEEDLCRHSVSYHKKGKQATLKMIKEPRKLAALTFPTLEFLDCD